MARRQAKRHKKRQKRKISLPRFPLAPLATIAVVTFALVMTYQISIAMLDRPIRSIEINGPFQRVTALQIEEAINDDLDKGFLSADLTDIQQKVVALSWIDHANISRRWPSKIVVTVSEQIPAACWGERGLLNTRGELFVTNASHVPAELPRLSGPEDQASAVARRYLKIREQLIPLGLDVRRLHVDARGAWDMTLQNGIDIRLGRRDVAERTRLFLDVVANIVSSKETEIDFVDMRYSNGFTIGWKNGSQSPAGRPKNAEQENTERELVAGRTR
jgi:cell division protein FtsQ